MSQTTTIGLNGRRCLRACAGLGLAVLLSACGVKTATHSLGDGGDLTG